jgi:predicted nucleotidyltransferase
MLSNDPLDNFRGKPEVALQAALLKRVIQVLSENKACLAAALVGSFAKGKADRVSDLDLLVCVEEGAEQAISAQISSLIDTQNIFFKFSGKHDERSVFIKYIFLDFTSFEFHVGAPSAGIELRRPFIELINRNNTLQSLISDLAAPEHGDDLAYVYGDEGLAWELFSCIKWLKRGDAEMAKTYLHKLTKAINEASDNRDQI